MPIFLSARPGDPAQPEQPAKLSEEPEPPEGKELVVTRQMETGRDEKGETADGLMNGAAAAEEDREGEVHSRLLIELLTTFFEFLSLFLATWRDKMC